MYVELLYILNRERKKERDLIVVAIFQGVFKLIQQKYNVLKAEYIAELCRFVNFTVNCVLL